MLEHIRKALAESGQVSCGCCTSSVWNDKDDCPIEDGDKDHEYYGDCRAGMDRDLKLAIIVMEALSGA